MADVEERRRTIVSLFPQFLQRRRRGWRGIEAFLEQARLERPQLFLLREIVQETDPDEALSLADLRARLFNPYSTIFQWLDLLPQLVAEGYVHHDEGAYTVTASGRALIEELERQAQTYLAALTPIPETDLTRLADLLSELATRSWAAPEPGVKPHQARAQRVALTSDAPLPRLDLAIYALWTARDDAHTAAWQGAGFEGPALDLLTRLWAGEATTLPELIARIGQAQHPRDVEHGVTDLETHGYLRRDDDALMLTAQGREIRDQIEAETDRVYFATWQQLTPGDLAWLHETLHTLIDRLPV
ncbi:MAG TPA: hypothetical protein VGD69_06050 [Herpetosiphonaceae bacterium]